MKKYAGNTKQLKVIISTTVMAWNMSVLPEEKQASFRQNVIGALPEMGKTETQVFSEFFDNLVDRKKKYFPKVQVFITKHELLFNNGDMTLNVASAVIQQHKNS